jgi:hypothetical protein
LTTENKKPRPAWADEPTPLTDHDARFVDGDSGVFDRDRDGPHVTAGFARDLERRLRHALKLVNSLRIDAMHAHSEGEEDMDSGLLDGRLSDIEEVLQ